MFLGVELVGEEEPEDHAVTRAALMGHKWFALPTGYMRSEVV